MNLERLDLDLRCVESNIHFATIESPMLDWTVFMLHRVGLSLLLLTTTISNQTRRLGKGLDATFTFGVPGYSFSHEVVLDLLPTASRHHAPGLRCVILERSVACHGRHPQSPDLL